MKEMTAKDDSERFRTGAEKYAAYLQTPAGRLRLDLTFASLQEFLPQATRPLIALDLGGGTGAMAVRLAELGLHVTLLDNSPSMLELAKQSTQQAGVSERIALKHGDASELATLFPAGSFDVVLCHNVLEFVADPGAVLAGVADVLRIPSGIVSVLVRNQAGEVLKAAIKDGDLPAADHALTAEWGNEALYGGKVRLFAGGGLRAMLAAASLTLAAERGVRVISDYLPPGVPLNLNDEYERIFALERKAGKATGICGTRPLHALPGASRRTGDKGRFMNHVTALSSSSGSRMTPDDGISLGLGLTNECNLACAFCYRDPARTDRLSLDQVKAVIERLPVRSVNLGTGENGMHPEFKAILAYLRTKPVKLTITSNGHSVAVLEDDELRAFHDIEFSLDYATQAEQDAQRGDGNWELIHQQAERCRRLGIPVTIIAVMMKSNYLRLADVARVAKQFDAPLRVNVYQAVRSDLYALTYEEYWEGFRHLFADTDVIAIGEPLVRAIAGLPSARAGCGLSTVRVTPRATTQPCVYWPGPGEPLSDLISAGVDVLNSTPFEQARTLPEACIPCEFRESCHGGCAGRRRLQGELLQPDSYCPIIRGDRPLLEIRMAPNRDLPKLSSSCTTVVIAR